MKRPLRLTLFAFAGLALSAAFVHALSSWVSGEEWNPRATGESLVRENQRQEALDRHDQIVAACLEQKYQVTSELIAGRLTLAEAVRYFHACEVERDERLGKEASPLDASREAVIARSVLRWAAPLVRETGAGRERLEALEQEFQARFNARPAGPGPASG